METGEFDYCDPVFRQITSGPPVLPKEGVLDEPPTPSLTSPFAPPTGVLHNWLGVRPIFVSNLVHKPLAPLSTWVQIHEFTITIMYD